MAYQLPQDKDPRILVLQFEEPYEGAEVKMLGDATVDEIIAFQKAALNGDLEELATLIRRKIVAWNLEGRDLDDRAVHNLPLDFLTAVSTAYLSASASVSGPLAASSSSGNGSAAKDLLSQLH